MKWESSNQGPPQNKGEKHCRFGKIGKKNSRGYYGKWAEKMGTGYTVIKREGFLYKLRERGMNITLPVVDIWAALEAFVVRWSLGHWFVASR